MKRIVSVIMAGFLMIACTSAVVFAQEQKYEELIRYLDEGDYDAAREYIDKLQEAGNLQESETDTIESDPSQASSSEDIIEIELTPDNFRDYFDIVFSNTETYMDAFDEEISSYGNTFVFVNKAFNDGRILLDTSDDFALETNIQYLEGGRENSMEITFTGDALKTSSYGFSHYDSEDVSITDFSVSRIKGSVFFAKKDAVDYFERVESNRIIEGYEVYGAGIMVNGGVSVVNNIVKPVSD